MHVRALLADLLASAQHDAHDLGEPRMLRTSGILGASFAAPWGDLHTAERQATTPSPAAHGTAAPTLQPSKVPTWSSSAGTWAASPTYFPWFAGRRSAARHQDHSGELRIRRSLCVPRTRHRL